MSEKRNRDEIVRELFDKKKIRLSDGKEISVSMCTLCGEDGKPFKCETLYNLTRHLILKHRQVAEEKNICVANSDELVVGGDYPEKPEKITLHMDKNVYITSIVRWLTEFQSCFFSKECVSNVLQPLEKALKLSCVSRKNIMRYVGAVEARMVAHISDQMQGKLIFVKADLASTKGRSVLSINAQFVSKGKIIVVTLAMVESMDRNTAENIFAEIMKVLDMFKVNMRNVYSIKTDNGSNFLKATKLMRNAQMITLNGTEINDILEEEKDTFENENDEADDFEIENENTKQPEINFDDEDEEFEMLDFSKEANQTYDQIPEDELPIIDQPNLTGVRCAAHDIQLSVYDVFKQKTVSSFLAKVRKLVKKLRCQPYVNSFKRDKTKNMPMLDGDTRWGSSHLMVNCIEQQKAFIQELLPANLRKDYNEHFWTTVTRFVRSTLPLYILTKRVQEESLTCGTMYLSWKECCLELAEINDPLAKELLEALKKRQGMWFDNPAFIAALYVDPRLHEFDPPVLSAEQKEIAVRHLMTTWKSICIVRGNSRSTENATQIPSTSASSFSRVENLLTGNRQYKSSELGDMEKRVRKLPLEMSASLDTDVIQYWESRKRNDKELVEIALTVSQLPCTQVSVERTFNGLGQILTKSRMKLGPLSLSTILFVKANGDLFDELYFQYNL